MTNRAVRTGSVALVAVSALLLGTGPKAASWDGASVIPGTVGNIYGLKVALADNGDAVAIWVDVNDGAAVVKAAIRPAGQGWRRPQNLSRPQDAAGFPDLAVDRKGNAFAVWRAAVAPQDVVQAAVRRTGGGFRRLGRVAAADQSVVGSLGPPKVTIGRTGMATVVFAGGTYNDPLVRFADGTTRGFGAVRTLAHGRAPVVAADPAGNVTVAWTAARGGVEAAFRPHGGRFRGAQALGGGSDPSIAVNARGDAVVAWGSASYPQDLLASFRRAGKSFGPAETVGSAGDFARGLKAAVDPRGAAIVLWGADRYDAFPLQAAVRPPNGRFAPARVLSPDTDGFDLAVGRRGDVIALWSRYAGDFVVQSAVWERGRRAFGTPRNLSQRGYNAFNPAVALDSRGHGLALWQRSQGSDFILQARDYGAVRTTSVFGGAGSAWVAPSVLSPARAHGERVAVDADGRVTIVWTTDDGTDQGAIETVSRLPGGRFGAPQQISARGVWAGPDIGVDGAGATTVVWASGAPPHVAVHASTRPPAGSFGGAQEIASPTGYVYYPRVAVNERGDALASWVSVSSDGSSYTFDAAFRPAGGTFGAPEQVSNTETLPPVPNVALDAQGDAVAVWAVTRGGPSFVQAALRPAGGHFGHPETLAEAPGATPSGAFEYVSEADVAIDARGDAFAVWSNSGTIQAAVRQVANGTWERPLDITDQTRCCGTSPSIAVDVDGRALIAWVSGADGAVRLASRPPNGSGWGAPQTISRPDDHVFANPPTIAVGQGNTVVVAWTKLNVIGAAIRGPEGTFAPPRTVSQAGVQVGGPLDVSVDANGDAIAVWRVLRSALPRFSHSGYVEAAAFDATAPELGRLRVPVSGRVGAKLSFSAAPVDAWTGVASVRWRFGDGKSATGRRVSHAYRRVGNYRVSVTATDEAGNQTTSTARLLIGRAP